MNVILKDGKLCLTYDDGTVFAKNISAWVESHTNDWRPDPKTADIFSSGEWTLESGGDKSTARCGNTVMTFEKHGKGMFVQTEFYDDRSFMRVFDNFCPLRYETPCAVRTILSSSVHHDNGNRLNEMGADVRTARLVYGERYEGSDFAAVEYEDGTKIIAGFATQDNFFGQFETTNGISFSLKQFCEYHPSDKPETFRSDIMYILPVNDIVTELVDFTRTVAEKQAEVRGMTLPEKFEVPTGSCTWYYHLWHVYGKPVLEELDAIKANRDRYPLKYYQIDDGWEDIWGDWEANEKFPEGMKFYADKIKEAGLIPGIWIAPFGAKQESEVFKNHPEYFVRHWNAKDTGRADMIYTDGDGRVNFDFSVPGACEYITGVIRRLTYDWGYRYLKLDIIAPTIAPRRHSDPEFNACRNFAKGLEVMKNAAPEGTFFLLCTSPFIPSIGYADGMRVSGDIGRSWNGMKDVVRNTLKRYYYHNIFFSNDADCLIIRKEENEDDDCLYQCTRNDTEIRTYISAVAASGGALMLSDKLGLLDEKQLKSISYLYPMNTDAALPLDLMDSQIPGILDCGTKGGIRTVILINWYDIEQEYTVEVGKKHAYEFWTQTYEGVTDGKYTAAIAPHDCRVMFFTDADKPAVIASDSVLIPDIKQSYADGKLTFEFSKKGECVTVIAKSVSGDNCETEKISENMYKIKQTGESLAVCLSAE